ncbi:ATPase family AAA domain-containing protein 1-B [Nibea albiflora]|uniref:ATPase family AAA domain-containing protein 1-B n=1 Tax=Nibea albiflora TaxID=240163 RepID=A0ACB7F5F3_NIBAL|nr:ATPase family AAA domain-containing protein 1-B [Nibea albiflora]
MLLLRSGLPVLTGSAMTSPSGPAGGGRESNSRRRETGSPLPNRGSAAARLPENEPENRGGKSRSLSPQTPEFVSFPPTDSPVLSVLSAGHMCQFIRPTMDLSKVPAENIARPLGRNEVIGLLFRLTIFGAVTYFTIKWMVDAIDPTRKQKVEAQKQAEKLMRQIGVKNVKLSEYEMSIAAHLVDPLSMHITWRDIAGLDEVITELKETVILPVQKRHLFQGSRLLQPPKGVLLYGPPGCGKTLIAKATAKEAGFRFINLQPSTLTDKWYGESQKLAAAVFSLAVKLQPSIIFVDEIVDLIDVAKETEGFSGSDLREMCRDAALLCVRDFVHMQSDSPSEDFIRPIHQSDLQRSIGKMKKSKSAGGHGALLHAALD